MPVHSQDILLQMPEDEKGHKQLGRGHALSHLAQLGLTLLLGILVMAEPWPTVSAWRAVYGGFGIVYALQVSCSSKGKACDTSSVHMGLGLRQLGFVAPG